MMSYYKCTNTNRTIQQKKISSSLMMIITSLLLIHCLGFIKYTNGYNTTPISKVENFLSIFLQQQQQYQQQQRVLQEPEVCNLCPNDNEELIPDAEYVVLDGGTYKCSDPVFLPIIRCFFRQGLVNTICCRTISDNPNKPAPVPVQVSQPSPTVQVPVPVVGSDTASPEIGPPSETDLPTIPFTEFDDVPTITNNDFPTTVPVDDSITTTTQPPQSSQMTVTSETSANILIRIESVPFILNTPELISTFEFIFNSILDNSIIALLLQESESFTSISKVTVNVTVTSQRQQQQQSTLNRSIRRIQQSESQFVSNNVITNIDGTFTNTGNNYVAAVIVPADIWRKVIIQAINDNEKIIIDALIESNSVYYTSLSTVTSSVVDTGTDNSNTGSPSSYSSLSSGGIVGIVIATTIGIVLAIILYIFITKNKKNRNDATNNDDVSLKEDYFDNVDDAETLRQLSYRTRLNTNDNSQQLQTEIAATTQDQTMASIIPVTDNVPKRVNATKNKHEHNNNSNKTKNSNQPIIKIKKIIPMPETIELLNEKTITVPTGTLGLLVETNNEFGPTITEINSSSPLIGQVTVRDVIASINGTNTLSMTGSAVAKLLSTTSTIPNRTMIILSHSTEAVSSSSSFNRHIQELQDQQQPEQYNNENQSIIDIASNHAVCSSVQSVVAIGKNNNDRTNPTNEIQSIIDINSNGAVCSSIQSEAVNIGKNNNNNNSDDRMNIEEKIIIATPGQLKLILEETIYGLKINGIQNDCPLLNQVSIGDTIVQVNGKDCTTMSVSDISNLRFGLDINERQLVVVSRVEPTTATTSRGTTTRTTTGTTTRDDDNNNNDDNDSEDIIDIDLSSNIDHNNNVNSDDVTEIDLSDDV